MRSGIPRDQGLRGVWALARMVLGQHQLWSGFARHTARMFWAARREWIGHGLRVPPVRKISFFTHNFMDACNLETDRIEACVFMAATVDGSMSMCAYNTDRDRFLLQPIRLNSGETWQPLAVSPDAQGEVKIPLKWLKGKPRELALRERANQRQAEELTT